MGNYYSMGITIEEKLYKEIEEYFIEKSWNSKVDVFTYILKQLLILKKYHTDINPLSHKIYVSNMAHRIKKSYFVEKPYEQIIDYSLISVNHNFSLNQELINYSTLEKVFKFCISNPKRVNSIRDKVNKVKAETSKEYNKKIHDCFITYIKMKQNHVLGFMKNKNNKNLSNIIQNSLIFNKELSNIFENYIEDKIENSDLETKAQYRKIKRLYISSMLDFEETLEKINEIVANNKGIK